MTLQFLRDMFERTLKSRSVCDLLKNWCAKLNCCPKFKARVCQGVKVGEFLLDLDLVGLRPLLLLHIPLLLLLLLLLLCFFSSPTPISYFGGVFEGRNRQL
jgi:hypothetical protein